MCIPGLTTGWLLGVPSFRNSSMLGSINIFSICTDKVNTAQTFWTITNCTVYNVT